MHFLVILGATMSEAFTGFETGRTSESATATDWKSNGMLAAAAIAAFSFVLHMLVNGRYGYFRDEFDYIICGRHPAWGYVDQPPLLPILSRIVLGVFGESLRSVRLLPAFCNAALKPA